MRRLLSTFLHILALDTKPVAPEPIPAAPASTVSVDALLDLALVMDARWEGTALSGPGYESHGLVAAALHRIFPGNVHTVERCPAPECQLNGCDECATDAQIREGDAKLTAFLAEIARPDMAVDEHREALRAIRFALAIDDHYDCREFLAGWLKGDTADWPEFAEGAVEPLDDEGLAYLARAAEREAK